MKKIIFLFLSLYLLISCHKNDDSNNNEGVNFRQEMRNLVQNISQYGKAAHSGFIIIPQNGIELISKSTDNPEDTTRNYLDAIDAVGQEDFLYGYNNDDEATPTEVINYLTDYLDITKDAGKTILAIDYCSTTSKMLDSYQTNAGKGYISFAADHRELNNIPSYPAPIFNENSNTITNISQIKNYLYLINPANYSTKSDFISAVTASNYDMLIMDLFFNDGTSFTSDEINQLRNKANGGKRLVISYMSIGEAENYRYYWQSSWASNKPEWLGDENPDWEGNYKVKYWNTDWQKIIYGSESAYLDKILNAGFDGVYLDIIDAFEYYE